jgi:copper chaperone CopZ
MKKLLIVTSILISSIFANAQFQSASLTAAGLTCAMCTKAIYNALDKLPAVEKVDADIKSSSFLITFKKDASVDPDKLKDAVEDAGFSVSSFKLTGQFNNFQISNDAHVDLYGKSFHFIKANNKVLNGTQTLTVVDKHYVSAKQFKKVASLTDHPCVETGKAEACCAKLGTTHNPRIYHVML